MRARCLGRGVGADALSCKEEVVAFMLAASSRGVSIPASGGGMVYHQLSVCVCVRVGVGVEVLIVVVVKSCSRVALRERERELG